MTHAMTYTTDALKTLSQAPRLPLLAVAAVRIAALVTKWSTRARTRRALANLTPDQLYDVGITPAQARTETARAFWLS